MAGFSLEWILTLPKAKPLAPIPHPAEQYVREIWKEHCSRRQSEFPFMSSAEFSLAYGWWEQGIQLATVFRAMSDTQKPGSSLFYYKVQVQAAYELWRKALGPYVMAEYEAQR